MKKKATKQSVPRQGRISRIEGLSDSIFAFVVTLLVMSTEVPRTFSDLQARLAGKTVLVFAFCFAVLMLVWNTQNKYFREYGLEDGFSLFWNSMLLLTVLFSVYPLKLVAAYMIDPSATGVAPNELPELMAMFSAGVFMVSFVFTALFHHALNHRDGLPLGVDAQGRTIFRLAVHLGNGLIALLSWLIASFSRENYLGASWWVYAVLVPYWLTLYARYRRSVQAAMVGKTFSYPPGDVY